MVVSEEESGEECMGELGKTASLSMLWFGLVCLRVRGNVHLGSRAVKQKGQVQYLQDVFA